MKNLIALTLVTFFSVLAIALPQNVQMQGAFKSRYSGTGDNVSLVLKLKKESATKGVYRGRMTFHNQVMGQNQWVELTIEKNKNKTSGRVNTYDGYIAFEAKQAFALTPNEQLVMAYAEYQNDSFDDICNPIHDNFCRPNQRPPVLTDRGQLLLTVTGQQ